MEGSYVSDKGSKGANAQVIACWSCKGPVSKATPFCDTCGAVQPPGQVNHFQRMGLPVSFDVRVADLDQRYFDLQRHLHPDRFATRSAREKNLSQLQAIAINDSYEILKEPLKRADYLVHLKGTEVLPEGCNLVNDAELLMESMELREALAEAETVEQVNVLSARAAEDIKRCIEQLSTLFAENDVEGACKLTTRLKYLKKLAEETRIQRMKMN